MDKDTKTCYERWGYKVTGDIIQRQDDKTDPKTLNANDNTERMSYN